MNNKCILAVLAVVALGASAQAVPITFTFQENGSNVTLGASSTFTESGVSVKAFASSPESLYAKFTNGDPDETGLGIASDVDKEINTSNFIQLLPVTPGFVLDSLYLSSIQAGESATIWFSTTLGTLGSHIGTLTTDGPFDVSAYQNGYIGVSAGNANVLLATATGHIPDGGSTIVLLGGALTGLGFIQRKFLA